MDFKQFQLVGVMVVACFCFLFGSGCQKRVSLSGDAQRLEKAFALTEQSPPASSGDYKTAKTPELVKTAAVALRASDLPTAVKVLHILQYRGTGLTFDQFNTLSQTVADVSNELSRRAAGGDEDAKSLLSALSPH